MNRYFVYIIIFLLSGCSATKDKYDALNSYFETILKEKDKRVIIAKEKINSNFTIEMLKLNEIQAIDTAGNITADTIFFNQEDWGKLKNEYQNTIVKGLRYWDNNEYWTTNDFKHKKIVFENMNTKTGIEPVIEKYDKSDVCVYSFSEPIYYQNKKYIVFFTTKICIAGGNPFVVIMEKINNKWILTHKAYNSNLLN